MTYIVLEGIDGSGTTTQAQLLQLRLQQELQKDFPDRNILRVKEPTDSAIGKLTREYFEGKHGALPNWRTMLHLFQADRELFVSQVLLPALDAGDIVISDRCWISTFVYQSTSQELEEGTGADALSLVHKCVEHLPQPDKLLVIDLPLEVALERRRARNPELANSDHYERDGSFMVIAHRKYLAIEGIHIDGDQTAAKVSDEVFSAVLSST
jgi:dTMP kinase